MTLIKSISGIRGTIGGSKGDNLTPIDIVECVSAYGTWLIKNNDGKVKVVVGRDGRISGSIVSNLAIQSLISLGIDVINLGLSTTPTVEMAVVDFKAQGGIIFTASHNPKQWNALKFLNDKGEFISAQAGTDILNFIEHGQISFCNVDDLGSVTNHSDYIQKHIQHILDLDILDIELIKSKKYHAIVDCINSTGAMSIPPLLDALGCSYTLLNHEITGDFAHTPEPLPKNLKDLIDKTENSDADIGIAVDPDVDRLALVCENGDYFGEEYTLVAAADFVLSKTPGNTVSNLSSTRALADVTKKHNGIYFASAVGEVNVVNTMKQNNAVIGGEGNGGVIYPTLHAGRDALVGIAFVLNLMAEKDQCLSKIKRSYPAYTIIKNKIDLRDENHFSEIKEIILSSFKDEKINLVDGVKIDFENGWVHIRPSNTEPIIRVYAEAKTEAEAQALTNKVTESLA